MGYKSVNNIHARIAWLIEDHLKKQGEWLDKQVEYICRNRIKEPIVGEITKEEVEKRGLSIVYSEFQPVGIQEGDEVYQFNNNVDGNDECDGNHTV